MQKSHLSHNIGSTKTRIGCTAECYDLPDEDAKTPDVWFDGEYVVVEGFWRHPADRKTAFALSLVHQRSAGNITSKTKVCYFAHVFLVDQHITCCQVTVDYLQQITLSNAGLLMLKFWRWKCKHILHIIKFYPEFNDNICWLSSRFRNQWRKTKIMILNSQGANIESINIQQYNFEVVQEFIYLEVRV